MKLTVIIATLILLSQAFNNGAIDFEFDGDSKKLYIVSSDTTNQKVIVDDKSVTLDHPSGAFFASEDRDTLDADNYYQFKLLGKTLSYTVDMSTVGCSCNAALYFVSMPGYDSSGNQDPSLSNNYYCDANQVNGV